MRFAIDLLIFLSRGSCFADFCGVHINSSTAIAEEAGPVAVQDFPRSLHLQIMH
jgi:hypothetical protein